MKILLTGFEPFGKVLDNPSQRVVEHFAAKPLAAEQNVELITAVLPVDYIFASMMLEGLLVGHKPDAVLMLGVAQMRDSINLERIAININDAKIADNAGNLKTGQPIVEDAPVAYRSTLPLEAMYEAIQDAGIAVTYSNHAGAYLCNHVFYYVRHWLENAGMGHVPCGFIHLPDLGEEAPKMPLAKMIQAVELVLKVIKKERAVYKDILKSFERRLLQKPEWIGLWNIAGLMVGGINIPWDMTKYEGDPSVPILHMVDIPQRISEGLKYGQINFNLVSTASGFILIAPVLGEFVLAIKFNSETTYTDLAIHSKNFSKAVEELRENLKNLLESYRKSSPFPK